MTLKEVQAVKILFVLIMPFVFFSCSSKKSNIKDNILFVSFSSEPESVNPISANDVNSSRLFDYTVSSLLILNEDTWEYMPGVAESWEVGKDGMSYTFKLRKSVKFQNGDDLKASDVKFSFDAIFDKKFQAAAKRPYYENFKSPQIIDDYTIKFPVKKKYFANFRVLAGLGIVPESVYSKVTKKDQMSKVLVGSGPYKIKKYNKGKSIILEKNKDWFGFQEPVAPYLKGIFPNDNILIRFIKEETIREEYLKKSKIDYMSITAEQFVKKIDTKKPDWSHVESYESTNKMPKGYSFMAWNLKNPLFKSKKTRKALAHLVNREMMNEKFMFGKNVLSRGPFYTGSLYEDKSVPLTEYSFKKAKSLLEQDGWSDSNKDGVLDKKTPQGLLTFKFSLLLPGKVWERDMTLVKEEYKKAGIQMDITIVDWSTFVKSMDDRKFDAIALAWGGGSIDPDPKQIWHTKSQIDGGSNFISYSNKRVDTLIDKARVTLEREKRIPLLKEIFRLIVEDAPYVFMFSSDKFYIAANKRVKRPKDTLTYGIGTDFWSISPEIQ